MSSTPSPPDALIVDFTGGKNLKLDLIGAFKGLFGVLAAKAAPTPAKWAKAGQSAMGVLKAVKIEQSAEGLAYELIYKATLHALQQVLEEYQETFPQGDISPSAFAEGLAEALKGVKLEITADFFAQPDQLSGIAEVEAALMDWLAQVEVSEDMQARIGVAFRKQFVSSLISVWVKGQSKFDPIEAYFKHPFQEVWVRQRYEARLAQLYQEKVWQHETMQLNHLYVAPDFRTYVGCFNEKDERVVNFKEHQILRNEEPFIGHGRKYTGNLHDYVKDWLQGGNPLDQKYPDGRIFLLLGYPGQGKSSFCARLLHDVLTQGWTAQRVFFVKLRDLRNVKNLLQDPLDTLVTYLKEEDLLFEGEVDIKTLKQAVLILDGLDELFMKEGLTKGNIEEFCRELGQISSGAPEMRVVLTSRYGYVNLQSLKPQQFTIHRLQAFTLEQQKTWLRRFKAFVKLKNFKLKDLVEIQREESPHHHLAELVNQPILLYMLAEVDTNLSEAPNKSALYEKLFETLLERKWATDGTLAAHTDLKTHHLKDFLAFIALKIYQSPFEYIRSHELEAFPEAQSFMKKRMTGLDTKNVLSALMMSFYMRQVAQRDRRQQQEDENYALEFLHKSLQEHLVAGRIWKAFQDLKEKDGYGEVKEKSPEEVLAKLYPVLAPKALSEEVREHLLDLIALAEQTQKDELFTIMVDGLEKLVLRDFVLPEQLNLGSDPPPVQQALQVFYGYWTVLSHLSPMQETGALTPLDADILPTEALRARFFYLLVCFQQPPP
ncbi:MAG TPA: hypothetical protein DCP28_16580, partial [Cytophagales bacterium]|nr:hypothetical protein [Cytophagales bacterium]